jgi:hypothetical protein
MTGYQQQPYAPAQAEPDWVRMANDLEARSRRRKLWLGAGAAVLCVLAVAGGTLAITGKSPRPAPPAAGSAAPVAPVAPVAPAASPSAAPTPAPSRSAAPSPTRAPVTTPTVPGKPGLLADHSGQADLTIAPDAAAKSISGGWVLAGKGTANSYAQGAAVVDVSGSFTVSAWVVNDAPSGSRSAISQGDGAFSAFDLGREDAGGQKTWSFHLHTGSGPNDLAAARAKTASAAATGQFTLLTGVYDAAQHTVTLYVDGAPAATAKVTGTPAGTGPFQLGRSRTSGAWSAPWTGVLGHVQAWNRALTAAQVAKIKSDGGPGPNLPPVGAWLV